MRGYFHVYAMLGEKITTCLADYFHCLFGFLLWANKPLRWGDPLAWTWGLLHPNRWQIEDGLQLMTHKKLQSSSLQTTKSWFGTTGPWTWKQVSLKWEHNPGQNKALIAASWVALKQRTREVVFRCLILRNCEIINIHGFLDAKFFEMCYETLDNQYISEHSFLPLFWKILYAPLILC